MVAWQDVTLGRVHAGKTVTITVSDTALAIECDDGIRTVHRINPHPVTRIKSHRPPNGRTRASIHAGGTRTSRATLHDPTWCALMPMSALSTSYR
ncbi:hypothetical protein [Micromonospora chokoriensis]|uniref:hypothetical protein n=1 Tax=Micromonospora chokoriensis TaxID=356851 RepID=UPI000B5ACD43|nr:hypothetical protein [Micromonospora chokoriensis]